MGDVIDHIDARDALLLEQEYRLAFLLAEDRHQHIGTGHFTLAGTLHMEDRTLQYALETKGRLGFALVLMHRDQRRGRVDEFAQIVPQLVHVCPAGTQDGSGGTVVQKGQQEVLDRHEFMTFDPSILEGEIEGDFKFAVQHTSPHFTSCPRAHNQSSFSISQSSGC
ncbi:hypothetical protein D3C75_690850 [compost metagenome]